jgi:undecaprenyl diphosphate synthase
MSSDNLLHVAVIMDGNGRWARSRGLPRVAGHRRGAEALRRAVEAAPDLGIGTLTVYAFSSDNWKRPSQEINALMRLFGTYLRRERDRCVRNGVRVSVIGRRDRLPPLLIPHIEECESATAGGEKLWLRLAVDYSSRDAVVEAARRMPRDGSREDFEHLLDSPAVDVLIRTAGEQRLSDFLLWESAYAELVFAPVMWPDFEGQHLANALAEFRARERRFGGLTAIAAGSGPTLL